MSAECTTESCETNKGCCASGSEGGCKCPGCGQASCPDPIACGMKMWGGSFFQALQAVQVDILKTKIQKAYGPVMDKAADAALQAIGEMWGSTLATAKAKADFRSRLEQLWYEKK